MHSSVHKIETIFSLQNNLIWVYNHSYDYRPESLTVQLLLNKKNGREVSFLLVFFLDSSAFSGFYTEGINEYSVRTG